MSKLKWVRIAGHVTVVLSISFVGLIAVTFMPVWALKGVVMLFLGKLAAEIAILVFDGEGQ